MCFQQGTPTPLAGIGTPKGGKDASLVEIKASDIDAFNVSANLAGLAIEEGSDSVLVRNTTGPSPLPRIGSPTKAVSPSRGGLSVESESPMSSPTSTRRQSLHESDGDTPIGHAFDRSAALTNVGRLDANTANNFSATFQAERHPSVLPFIYRFV